MSSSASWPIIGHQKIINYLREIIRSGSLSHAYLFSGPSKVGKSTLVKFFAQTIQCQKAKSTLSACGRCSNCLLIAKGNSPDTIIVDEKENIKIEKIREIQHQLSLRHFHAPYKIVIILAAHLMTKEAANSLLKTLEEPPQATLLILTTDRPELLLTTIVSRCQLIKLYSVPTKEIKEYILKIRKDTKLAEYLSGLVAGRPGVALEVLGDRRLLDFQIQLLDNLIEVVEEGEERRLNFISTLLKTNLDLERILDFWFSFLRDVLLASYGLDSLILNSTLLAKIKSWQKTSPEEIISFMKKIAETKEQLKTNINRRLALENLILQL